MRRRALLASITSSLALAAGCADQRSSTDTPNDPQSTTTTNPAATTSTTTDSTTTDSTTTDSTTTTTIDTPQTLAIDETATVDGGSVRVTTVAAQRSAYVLSTAHHTAPVMPPDSQFLLATFQTTLDDGHGEARAHTHLELDGERYDLADQDLPPAGGGFQLAYAVPLATTPTSGRLVWQADRTDVATWRLPDAVLTSLVNPPSFTVTRFDVPETAPANADLSVSVSVENTGSGPGTFRAQLGVEGVYSELPRFEQSLEAGAQESRTVALRHDTPAGETATAVLNWGRDRIERTVDITDD